MAIRYDKKINSELSKTVRNFNSKIARLQKTRSDLILPEKVSMKDIKSSVTSRKELNRTIKNLQSFSVRGAEEVITTPGGYVTSRYEFEKTKRELRYIKGALTRQIKRIENIKPRVFGVEQSATYKQMGNMKLMNLIARRESLNKARLEKLDRAGFLHMKDLISMNESKLKYNSEIFMDNYTDKMLFDLAYFVGYDKDKLNYIKEKLVSLDEKEFMSLFDTELSIQAIRDYYPETNKTNPNPEYIKEDVNQIYDNLYNNIDDIVKDYKK